MEKTPDLSRRARKILHAVVSEYLHSGEAVGSRTVTRKHNLALSPATVRNVMADLEELGLLEQRHTSAGRVPTETGLRFFIDSLLKVRTLTPREKDEIRQRYRLDIGGGITSVNEVIVRTSKLLSDITSHAGIVLAPNPSLQRLSHIEFRPLRQGKFLCILVTSEGRIENRLVPADFPVDASQLDRIHNYLNELLAGLTLTEVKERVLRELGAEKNQYDDLVSQALRLGKAALEKAGESVDVVVSGQANLLDPNAADAGRLERMRELLRALEEKEIMVKLLDRTLDAEGIQVFLGAETAFSALEESSVVAVPYGPEERPIGAIAVIGPMRMNYGKIMSIVEFTADVVSEIIEGL